MTRRLGLALAGTGCLVLCAATGAVVHAGTPALDLALHDALLDLGAAPGGERLLALARVVTAAGSTTVIWPVIAAAALVFPTGSGSARWVTSLAVAAAAGTAIGVRLLVSNLIRRTRPPGTDWATVAGGWAFPSGHTTAATLGAGVLAWALSRHLHRREARVAVWAVAAVWAGSVGLTRALLGVHWPLDVVGGWLLGAGWLCAMAAGWAALDRIPARVREDVAA